MIDVKYPHTKIWESPTLTFIVPLEWLGTQKTKKRVVVVDMDVVCPQYPPWEKYRPEPRKGCKEALQDFKENGDTVIIYSSQPWDEYDSTRRWLDDYSIPYDNLIMGKLSYDLWIDPKAIQFISWDFII